MPDDLLIHTIGHSDHETAAFIDLLQVGTPLPVVEDPNGSN